MNKKSNILETSFFFMSNTDIQYFKKHKLLSFLSTYIDLICLNNARKAIAPRSHHTTPQLVQPDPRSVIAAQIKDTLQTQHVRSIFLSG